MGHDITEPLASVIATCGKVVIETRDGPNRVVSAKRALELASALIEGAATATGQKAGVRKPRRSGAA